MKVGDTVKASPVLKGKEYMWTDYEIKKIEGGFYWCGPKDKNLALAYSIEEIELEN